ncbi:SMC family ATPase [Paenibacillus psychroresistens]|uniref:Nuclease SbcCD subunit C n=1 Tax=Paenibacillus psychroresistens TaxID=1778678 RepID=A0A6B8RIK4_9BACL|nr:AAA family ATPase [Paenibacillus psychroresistens]QGQ95717.1 SMC family ATPase [Paenibacillus psychroresistens]
MKPIQLTWAGLQSYREKQEIDFTLLCDAGVFGIFGPTGSGKSTILDAITLALYGKVERASNGTQGILNQYENNLSVSFTFELSHAEGSKKYRVERQFKRAADVSVTNTICRLIHIQAEQESIVIADKAGEVNAQIHQILGLSMQDFSRAVILPQGKFAEFLSLKGSDRRQMLQRLFHLEHYGDVLTAKVSQRTKETDISIKQILAEQQGLGDASEQALQSTKLLLEEADNTAKQKRIELQQVLQLWEEIKQTRALQQTQQELEANKFSLLIEEPRIVEQEQQLKLADQAERVRHFLQQFEDTDRLAKKLILEQDEIAKQHIEVTNQTESIVQQHILAKSELSLQDAPLQVKLEQLKQAVRLEQEIEKGLLQENELADKLELCKAQMVLYQEELLKKQDTHTRAIKKRDDLQEQLKSLEIKSEYRQNLQNALRDKHALDSTESKVIELEQQMSTKQQQLNTEKLREAEVTSLLKNNQAGLTTLMHAIKRNTFNHLQTEADLEALKINTTSAIEKIKSTAKSAEIAHYALHLADQLKELQPCPVCGSTEHPTPIKELNRESASMITSETELERHDLLLTKVLKLQFNQERQAMQYQALEQKLVESLAFTNNGETAEAEVAAAMPLTNQTPEVLDSIELLEMEHERLSEQQILAAQQITQISDELKIALQKKDRIMQHQIEISAQIQAIQTMYVTLEEQLLNSKSSHKQLLEQWQSVYTSFTLENIQLETSKLNQQDLAAEQLRVRVEQSIPFIEENLKETQQKIIQVAELEKSKIQLETEHRGSQRLNLELKNQFMSRWEQEIKAGESIAGYIQETELLLKKLRESEQVAQQLMEKSQNELMRINDKYITVRQAVDSAKMAFIKAEQFWQEALARTEFVTADDVKNAYLTSNQMEVWQQEVKKHREQIASITAKLAELIIKLNGKSVSETVCLDSELMVAAAKEMDEKALQDRAKIERDLEQLQSKHMHWKELEQNLSKLKQEFADLSKLQSVLRGNAFVEYIAEEQLIQVCRIASQRLGQLTRQRYALEVDSSGGFVIRDDANGGVRRPVSTLSGGETFLTSLALALALSAQIQLSGQYPLEFFFLDEGFGTLDPELLETVVEALEKLHIDSLTVGIISHVPELRSRLPRKLIVESAEPGGRGSRVYMEGL